MKKWQLVFGVLLVVFVLAAVSCGPAATPAPTPTPTQDLGKALVESKCSTCHILAQVQASRYDQAGWEATVQRMVAKGATLTPEQQKLVADYLALNYPKQ